MNAKNHLIRGAIVSALALTATLSNPVFAEYVVRDNARGAGSVVKPTQPAVANKAVSSTPRARIKRSDIYLNTP